MMNIYADRNEVKIRVKYIDIPIRYIYIFMNDKENTRGSKRSEDPR